MRKLDTIFFALLCALGGQLNAAVTTQPPHPPGLRFAAAYAKQYQQPLLYNRVGWVDIPKLAEKVAADIQIARADGSLLVNTRMQGDFQGFRGTATSTDDGRTWPVSKLLHEGPSAYSSLARLPDGTILCLYEGASRGEKSFRDSIRLARFNLEWLTGEQESSAPPHTDVKQETRETNDPTGENAWLAHGFTESQRTSLREAFRWGIENRFIPGGALLVIHRGEPVFREAFGVADLETGRPFTVDAPCRIASVTKPHTATLLAMLVEQGKLWWDDPLDKYLPRFAGTAVRGKGPAALVRPSPSTVRRSPATGADGTSFTTRPSSPTGH